MKQLLIVGVVIICSALSVFSQPNWSSWEFKGNQTSREFEILRQDMPKRGFRPMEVSTFLVGNDVRFNSIWQRFDSSNNYVIKTGINSNDYINSFRLGYFPSSTTVVHINGKPQFTGLWDIHGGYEEEDIDWYSSFDYSREDLAEEFRKANLRSYAPIRITAYQSDGKTYYNAVWQERDEKYYYSVGLSEGEFLKQLRELPRNFSPFYLDVLNINDQVSFSFIAISDSGTVKETFTGMESEAFKKYLENKAESGYIPSSIRGYTEKGILKYAGILIAPRINSSQVIPKYNLERQNSPQVSSQILPIDPVFQQTKVWCWLAVGEMIFRWYGLPNKNPVGNYQCGIIGTIGSNTPCGSNCFNNVCIIPSGSNLNTVKMLRDYAWISSGKVFNANEAYELPFATVKDNLDRAKPILAGISPSTRQYYRGADHVVLIIGYEASNEGISIIVNDPFPYPNGANPFINAGGKQIKSYQYKILLKNFTENLFWHWSIYDMSLR